jgi:hypothetical protein
MSMLISEHGKSQKREKTSKFGGEIMILAPLYA